MAPATKGIDSGQDARAGFGEVAVTEGVGNGQRPLEYQRSIAGGTTNRGFCLFLGRV